MIKFHNTLLQKQISSLYNKIYNFQGCGRRDMDEPLGTNLDCYVDMPNIPFRTGRTDCDSGAKPYIGKKNSKT